MLRLTLFLTLCLSGANAQAFCGLYVAKADAKLANRASKVVLIRDQNRTVVTMTSDYDGDAKAFALVVPVPALLERKQINVATTDLVDRLDEYSAPRVVEFQDPDPCHPDAAREEPAGGVKAVGVKVEASYEVGEYDIVILSAKESDGLIGWLKQNGYKLPKAAGPVLNSYIKRKLHFFVAKVNAERKAQTGTPYLRPLQMAFESARFDLPIRLGTVNAKGPQDLYVFALTRTGRVEAANYRNVKLASDVPVPEYVKGELAPFYKAMVDRQVKKDDGSAVYLEYAWDTSWCDPCAAEPLTASELKRLGVFWLGDGGEKAGRLGSTYLTRLHVRYDAKSFPEDLLFQVTADTNSFQSRFLIRHPFKGEMSCDAARGYRDAVGKRLIDEAKSVASLTGLDEAEVRRKMNLKTPAGKDGKGDASWMDNLWKD